MANQNLAFSDSFTAGADLSAKQYYLVELSAANTVTTANSAGEKVVGALLNKPTSGQTAVVAILGRAKVISSGSISANAYVSTTNAGKAQTASTGHVACGIAITGADADDIFEVLLTGPVIAP